MCSQDARITGYTVTEVPVELMFTDLDVYSADTSHLIDSLTEQWFDHHVQFADISIMRLAPHRELYRYFMGVSGSMPDAYWDWYEKIHTTRGLSPSFSREDLLHQRQLEYCNMKGELAAGSHFFHDHPIQAKFNPLGYFNIKDGHHRAAFLYCCGFRRLPVHMSVEDYALWVHDDRAAEVGETISLQQRKLIYTPILNPQFYHMRSERDEVYKTRLDYILEYLGPGKLGGKRVIDIGCNIGYYARHFAREGAVVTGIEPDPDHYSLLQKLNQMERTDFCWIPDSFETSGEVDEYDIGLLLTVFYHVMRNAEACGNFLTQMNRSIHQMLFWESGDQIEIEKRMLMDNTDFKHYEKLADTFGTGKYRELGVFLKK